MKSLMIKTTREKDNHEVFKSLTSQSLLQNYHYVVDTADDLMEASNKNIDKYIKSTHANDEYLKALEKSFGFKQNQSYDQGGASETVIRKTINELRKPQIDFDPKPDNSYFQFVPLIYEKPNALKPLDAKIKNLQTEYAKYVNDNPKIEYDPERNIQHYDVPHPYEQEIRELEYDWKKMIEEINNLDIQTEASPYDDSNFKYVDKHEDLKLVIEEISQAKELAVDLEYHSYRSYTGFT